MDAQIMVGPLLGLEGDKKYTVCFLADPGIAGPETVVDGRAVSMERIAATASGVFWRAAFNVNPAAAGRAHVYGIRAGGAALADPRGLSEWAFWVPGTSEEPRIAYASCNGFSSGDMKAKLDEPFGLWRRMKDEHQDAARGPFALLLMGGDQIYADEIWQSRSRAPTIVEWSELGWDEKVAFPVSNDLPAELDRFYESLYLRHWDQPEMAFMMASVPSIMMWDDHDIFDGWGSYPKELHECPVYQAIFAAARRHFELFQLRSIKNTALLNPAGGHYSFVVKFRQYTILGLDNRSDRTEDAVMSAQNWRDVKAWLAKAGKPAAKLDTLLVLSGIPVIYRNYTTTEGAFDVTPWQEELTDDIRDQWRSRHHEGERMKLIMNLLSLRLSKGAALKRVILSGDVHIGCVGIIRDNREAGAPRSIYQVISSAIVHPPPSAVQWLGILAGSNDRAEDLEGGKIAIELVEPYGAGKYLRTRNYASLQEGTDGKLWVTWACENGVKPEYPLEASA